VARSRSRSRSRLNFRDSQLQARLGLVSSAAATVFVLLLTFVVLQNFNAEEKTIAFNPKTGRNVVVLFGTGASAFFAAIGFILGAKSLGHKRNARQRESWVGLLLGAAVMSAAIVLFLFFRMFAIPIIKS